MFIHGLWLHSTSWQPWIDLFTEHGYSCSAPGWPGEPDTVDAARQQPDGVAGIGIDDVVDHFGSLISGLPTPPVLSVTASAG